MMLSPDHGVADTINSTIGLLVCGETPHTPYERSISQKTAIYGMPWRLPAREGGDAYGNRTRLSGVNGPRPRPLVEGATSRFAWASQRTEASGSASWREGECK